MSRFVHFIWYALVCVCNAHGQSTIINFDDLSAGSVTSTTLINNGYQGLNWNNFAVLNVTSIPFASGAANGEISSPNVAYNVNGIATSVSGSTSFEIITGYFTSIWNNGLALEITGYYGPTTEFVDNFTLNTSGSLLINLPDVPVTDVLFTATGGINAGYQGSGTEFVMDNLTIVATPEPSAGWIGAVGLVVLAAYRRQQSAASSTPSPAPTV